MMGFADGIQNNEPLTSVTMRLTQQFSCVEWHTERQ
jgi:hypothetical protein